jgi:hypothetical protein
MSGAADVLERFHGTLVEEIVHHHPQYLTTAFTVAEIYQNLVPYRTHRDRIGIEMNGDYEHALLRLLAGEGEYLVIDSEPALRALQDEVKASNPNTGVFREFAAVDVRLNPARLSPDGPTVGRSQATAEGREQGVATEDSPRNAMPVAEATPSGDEVASQTSEGTSAPSTCRWCRAELPKRTPLNYCPFCGMDVHVVPCPGCGEELEPDWRFCVSCGMEVGA